MVSSESSDDRTLGEEVEGVDRRKLPKAAGVGLATTAGVIATAGAAQISGGELVPRRPQLVPPRLARGRAAHADGG